MNKYQSHKIVEAGRIVEFNSIEEDGGEVSYTAVLEDGSDIVMIAELGDRILQMATDAKATVNGGWFVQYPDGYTSWSPHEAFTEGYDLVQPASGKSAIVGYRELNETELANMNAVKLHGLEIGKLVDGMRAQDDHDQRWISIGATHLQQGFMALTRAITKPMFF